MRRDLPPGPTDRPADHGHARDIKHKQKRSLGLGSLAPSAVVEVPEFDVALPFVDLASLPAGAGATVAAGNLTGGGLGLRRGRGGGEPSPSSPRRRAPVMGPPANPLQWAAVQF